MEFSRRLRWSRVEAMFLPQIVGSRVKGEGDVFLREIEESRVSCGISLGCFQVRCACALEERIMHLNKRLCECIGASILKPGAV